MVDRIHRIMVGGAVMRVAVACLILLMMSGCAVKQALHDNPRDPWEGYNRYVFAFNEMADAKILKPIATGYSKVVPNTVRGSIGNALSNLEELPTALNNFLQGDFVNGGNDLLRFLVNTTLGVAGVFDPATSMGLIKQEEDFGRRLRLGVSGRGLTSYCLCLGPSTARDFPGKVVDFIIAPVNWIGDSDVRTLLQGTQIVSTRAGFLGQEKVLRELSPDFYRQLRGFYLNRREHLIKDGASGEDEELYKEIEDE